MFTSPVLGDHYQVDAIKPSATTEVELVPAQAGFTFALVTVRASRVSPGNQVGPVSIGNASASMRWLMGAITNADNWGEPFLIPLETPVTLAGPAGIGDMYVTVTGRIVPNGSFR